MEVDERIKEIKVYVDGRSAELQNRLFELGAKQISDNTRRVANTNLPFLFVSDNGKIFFGYDMGDFSKHEYKEFKVSEVMSLVPYSTLRPFAEVLVRNTKGEAWRPSIFHKLTRRPYSGDLSYHCLTGVFEYCIPYKGNAHLIDATDEPQERR